jgi:hypothetical protein
MILYQLRCSEGHEFEAWFKDSGTYDVQAAGGDVGCPFCSDTNVSKAIMAPNISPSRTKAAALTSDRDAEERALEVAEKILEAVDALRQDVETNFDDVGDQFANEARRIHYGEADERGIFGEASEQDAIDLDEEGVEFYRLPGAPRRNN